MLPSAFSGWQQQSVASNCATYRSMSEFRPAFSCTTQVDMHSGWLVHGHTVSILRLPGCPSPRFRRAAARRQDRAGTLEELPRTAVAAAVPTLWLPAAASEELGSTETSAPRYCRVGGRNMIGKSFLSDL